MKKQESALSLPVAIWLLINYLVGYTYVYPLLVDMICDTFSVSVLVENIIKTGVYVFVFLTTVIPARGLLRYGWERFTDSYGKCLGQIFRALMFIFIFGAGISFIFSRFGISTSQNQQQINTLVGQHRIYYTLMAVVFAPFVEELVFRGAIFNSLRSRGRKVTGYVVSSFFFGLIHVITALLMGNYSEGLFILVYGGLGMILAYVYDRTDSIYCSILLHMINNAISLLGA